jgi:NAD(P)-dependent dehydrogenase (short-subunit alcohol dehydrogenase family)
MKDLAGKVAVVTGAASGIGLALAERLAAEGMRVVLADIEAGPLGEVESRMNGAGHEVASLVTDVSRGADIEALAEFTLRKYEAVHVLCSNAGVGIGGALWEHTARDWEWLLGVNLWGVVHGVRTFVPIMLRQGEECHIVHTASAAGLDARPWLGMYSASKYAVVAISEALQQELSMTGAKIGVSVLCPAIVNTRIGEAERNRPLELSNDSGAAPPPQAQAFGEAFRAMLASGIPAADVAEAVVEAVRSNRLYILTNPETVERVNQRAARVTGSMQAEVTGV